MSRILIVSRTRMQHGVCVGGLNVDDKTFVRLHNEHGGNLPSDAPYQIGELWDLRLDAPWNPRERPHVEDKMVMYAIKIQDSMDVRSVVRSLGVQIYEGGIENIFEGHLKYTRSGKPFVNDEGIPANSVCFWRTDAALTPIMYYGKLVYQYKNKLLPFVGFQENQEIEAGTLVRMSLANWWQPEDGDAERRCYVQLSGWY